MRTKKTIKKMPPKTRQYARLINDLEKTVKRLNSLLPELERFERDSLALFNRNQYMKENGTTFIVDNDGLLKSGDEIFNERG